MEIKTVGVPKNLHTLRRMGLIDYSSTTVQFGFKDLSFSTR